MLLLKDFTYTINNGKYTIVNWLGTYQGEPSTKLVIPYHPNIIL